MPDLCLYFQVHQPYRLRRYRVFDIGTGAGYFDEETNRSILRRVVERCYLPANRLLEEAVARSGGRFRFALGLSGTLLDQLEADAPEALESFQSLAASGGVELLGETSHHSLASLVDPEEFRAQVLLHRRSVARHFGQRAAVFRNTELLWSDPMARAVAAAGFEAALVEGANHVLGRRSPNHVYAAPDASGLRLIPRHYRLSDDIGFRFSDREWSHWPLSAERWADWVAANEGGSVHVFLDYETFGEHHRAESGILQFLHRLPEALQRSGVACVHPSTLARRRPVDGLAAATPYSWADQERDASAWLGNRMQRAAHERLYRLGERVRSLGDPRLLECWRRLGTSDQCYYMSTKRFADGEVHRYFSPHQSPYDAFVSFMNVLTDLERRCGVTSAVLRAGAGEMAVVA
jgi:alpha-amylase